MLCAASFGTRIVVAAPCDIERAYLHLLLACHGHRVEEAANAEDLLRAVERWAPDAVVCDARLAQIDVRASMRRVQRLNGRQQPAVLLLIDQHDDTYRLGLDADAVFMRPFSGLALVAKLDALMAEAGSDVVPTKR